MKPRKGSKSPVGFIKETESDCPPAAKNWNRLDFNVEVVLEHPTEKPRSKREKGFPSENISRFRLRGWNVP
jgi:hypothetical protein